jgi:pimeloyl-ACP methyl ester carboxylesterase
MGIAAKLLIPLLMASAIAPAAPPPVPWSVPSRSPVERRDLSFTNAGDRIAGTLYAPAGKARVPVIVALHGAGAPSRDHPLYDHLKTMLPPLGIAVFVYDRRGTGASGGDDKRKTEFDLLAADGVAAMRMLAKDPRIDPRRMGFWGLSQGGWLSLLAAAKAPEARVAVSVSAPMTGADLQMNAAVENLMRIKGYAQADIAAALAARRTVDRAVRGEIPRTEGVAADAAARGKPWWRDSYLAGNIDDPTWPGMMATDPIATLDTLRLPTLIVYGQADPWVPVARSLQALDATAARHPNVTVRVIDGADHAMMLGVEPKGQIDPAGFARLSPNAPAYLGLLAAWLVPVLSPSPPDVR